MANSMLRVLVAPSKTAFSKVLPRFHAPNGTAEFCWTTRGELLTLPQSCDGGTWDDSCGCRRAFCGLDSLRSTTVGVVKTLPNSVVARLVKASKYVEEWTHPELGAEFNLVATAAWVRDDILIVHRGLMDLCVVDGDLVQIAIHGTCIDFSIAKVRQPRKKPAAILAS